MRILLVSHRFPPEHTAGTEVYSAELGARLVALGCQVKVFTAGKDVGRPDLSVHERVHRRMGVVELTNNLFLERFEETYRRPAVDDRFAQLLDEWRPDVVHVHHLLYLSSGLLDRARERGIPVVMTLHDFWLECPRFGQLVHADGSLCREVDAQRCGACLPSFPWRQSGLARGVGRALSGVRRGTGVDLAPLARGVGRALQGRRGQERFEPPDAEEQARYAEAVRERRAYLTGRVPGAVQRFLSPSRFLRERMVAWGLPAERITYLSSGVDRDAFAAPRRPRSSTPVVRFLGTFVPLKGAHVLLEAWGRLDPELRARGELHLHGPDGFVPEYVAELDRRAAALGVTRTPALDRAGVARALAETDLLVVPSLWFENRPLIVLEALAARVPLCVSDLGGLVELVEEGVAGWRFPCGDSQALASRLAELLAEPRRLEELSFDVDHLLPSWDEVAGTHLDLYRELVE